MVGFPFPFCNDFKNSPNMGCSISQWNSLLLYVKPFAKGWLEFLGAVWRKNLALALYSIGRDFNQIMQLWFLRFLWYEFSNLFFFLFHMYLVMFYHPFMIISNWMLLSMRGRIHVIFPALWKHSCSVCFLLFEKEFISYSLFSLSTVFPLHNISIFLAKLGMSLSHLHILHNYKNEHMKHEN